jgi:DNA-directed RNA polymerase specialized sigma subunit
MMQPTPNSLVRIVEREPERCSCGARLRPTIAVTVTAESRILAARHDALLLGYTDLVRYIAYHLFRRRNYVDVDDLIDAGTVGLSENIRRQGNDGAGSLQADVSACIRAAMLDFVRKSDWSVRAGYRAGEASKKRQTQ